MSFVKYFKLFSNYENSRFKIRSDGKRRLVETYNLLKTETVLIVKPFSHFSQQHIKNAKQLISEEKEHKAIILSDHIYQPTIKSSNTIYLSPNGVTKKG
jgi:ABC-type lipopolysaccharide export system ATPase subunit